MTNTLKCKSLLLTTMMVVFTTGCGPQEVPSASLWPDGAWVLYKQSQLDTDGNYTECTMKVSSVGKEMIDGKPFYWIEIRQDAQEGGVEIKKFLASERAQYDPTQTFMFWDEVKRIIIQTGTNTPEEIPSQHLKRFTPVFIESSKAKRFGNIKNVNPPKISDLPEISKTIDGEKLLCQGKNYQRKYVSEVNLGFLHLIDTTESSTEYYLHSSIPFGGVIKVKHDSTTTSVNKLKSEESTKPPLHFENNLEVLQFGLSGAKSQIMGDPVEKQILPFPFLKNAQKKS